MSSRIETGEQYLGYNIKKTINWYYNQEYYSIYKDKKLFSIMRFTTIDSAKRAIDTFVKALRKREVPKHENGMGY